MHILFLVLYILGGVILLILAAALFMKKGYTTHSEISISAPVEKTFGYLKQIRNQDNYNKWVMTDPNMQKHFSGTDGTVGFIYGWNGNKQAGEGEQEITRISPEKSIETEIRFVRPMAGVAQAKMSTASLANDQTLVTWSTTSTMKYPLNVMMPLIVKMLEKDMGESLNNLKNIMEG